jgi:hypothetical protein
MSYSLVGKDVDNVLGNAALRPVWIGCGEESRIGEVVLVLLLFFVIAKVDIFLR